MPSARFTTHVQLRRLRDDRHDRRNAARRNSVLRELLLG